MTSSSLRFRRKQGFTEMGKPDGYPRKDVNIIPPCGKFSGLSSKPPNGKPELHPDLSFAKSKLVVHDNHSSAKKRKFNKIETYPTNGFRNTWLNFERSSKRKSSNPDALALSLSPPDTNKKNEPSVQGGSSSPSQQKSNHGSTPEAEFDRGPVLILMSCLNCYLHVMVSDANPKCPKCGKGDCLLDMFRVSPMKQARTV